MEQNIVLSITTSLVLLTQWQLSYHAVSGLFLCTWSAWSAWSGCNSACFGQRRRTRWTQRVSIFTCRIHYEYSYSGCNEVCHNGGSSTGSGCYCVTGYYGSCCNDQINCGRPGTTDNGQMTGSVYTYGASVEYSCNTHYTLEDGSQTRTCKLTGTWSGSPPRCAEINCHHPGTPDNGQMTGSVYTYGASVVYSCETHYTLVDGSHSRTCQLTGIWSGSLPRCAFSNTCSSNPCSNGGTCTNGVEMFTCTCLPGWSGVTCAEDMQPPVITGCNFNIKVNATTPLHFVKWTAPTFSDPMGNEIQVSANYPTPEYEFPWGDFVIQYNGVKSANGMTAECTIQVDIKPTPCEDLPVPDNGAVVCNDWRTDFGRYCQVVCHTGYSLPISANPDQWYVCGASGNWSPVNQSPLTCRSYSLVNTNTNSVSSCTDTNFLTSTKTNFINNLKASAFSKVCNDYIELCNANSALVMC